MNCNILFIKILLPCYLCTLALGCKENKVLQPEESNPPEVIFKKPININSINDSTVSSETKVIESEITSTNQKNKKNLTKIVSNQINSGETLSSILLPQKGVKQGDIFQLSQVNIEGLDFNKIQIGQRYDFILNSENDSLIYYIHYFSNENILQVEFNPFAVKKISSTDVKNIKIQETQVESSNSVKIEKIVEVKEPAITKSFLLGIISFSKSDLFVELEKQYHTKSKMYLEKETASAFKRMYKAAKLDGINLKIVSGARNYYSQKSIWERKFKKNEQAGMSPIENAKKILLYSSMPSTSRHHWGTDIDINSLEPSYFEYGRGKIEYDWLVKNGAKFGFCQTYSDFDKNDRSSGYQEESWHWTYMPKSKKFLAEYNKTVGYEDINGFMGSELAEQLGMIENYVNGISSTCE